MYRVSKINTKLTNESAPKKEKEKEKNTGGKGLRTGFPKTYNSLTKFCKENRDFQTETLQLWKMIVKIALQHQNLQNTTHLDGGGQTGNCSNDKINIFLKEN